MIFWCTFKTNMALGRLSLESRVGRYLAAVVRWTHRLRGSRPRFPLMVRSARRYVLLRELDLLWTAVPWIWIWRRSRVPKTFDR